MNVPCDHGHELKILGMSRYTRIMPKRRLTKKQVYRRRRIVVFTALVVVLAVIGFCVYSLGQGISAVGGLLSGNSATAITRSSVPSPKKTSSVKNCAVGDVELSLVPEAQSVAVGGSLNFTATITYKQSSSCLIDASDASRVLTIKSGNDTIWRSDSCPVNSRWLLLAKGDTDVQTITWNTNRTGSECADDSTLLHVDSGTYVAQLSLRDVEGVESDPVTVTVS